VALTVTIEKRSTLAASWGAISTGTNADSMAFNLAPNLDEAILSRDVGVITTVAEGELEILADDLRGEWIRITATDGTNTVKWYGYCPRISEGIDGSYERPPLGGAGGADVTIDTNRATYQVFGMGYHLSRQTVDGSWVKDTDNPDTTDGRITRVLRFNVQSRNRNQFIAGNRSTSKSVGNTNSIYKFDKTGSSEWTALDAAEHLLEVFLDIYGINFTFASAGQHASLANIVDAWDVTGMTYLEALSFIISPSRGFTFYFDDQEIHVVTITDTAITGRVGPTVVPANLNVHTVILNESSLFGSPVVESIEDSHFDEIEIRGAPLRVMSSFSKKYSNLESDWNATDKTNLDAETTDEGEQQEVYADVYTRFIVPEDWNGKMLPSTFTFSASVIEERVMRTFNTSAGGVNDALALWHYPDLVFERTLPLVDADNNQPKPVLAFVRIAGSPDAWHRVDKPNGDITGAGVSVLDDALGFQLHPRSQKQFSPADGDFDWNDLVFTASMYTHDTVRLIVTPGTGELGEITRKKILHVPHAHFWYIVPGTIIDHDGAGTLTVHAGGAVRNDTNLLLDLAHLAKAWYGRIRSRIRADYKEDIIPAAGATVIGIGHMIDEAGIGGSFVPAGTIISRMEYVFFPNRVTRWRTEYFDMDLRRSIRPAVGQLNERIARIEDYVSGVPVRNAPGGGGGGDYNGPHALSAGTTGTDYIAVGANRAAGASYLFRDTITIGLDALQKSAKEEVQLTVDGVNYIYYAITKTGATITATLTASTTYPVEAEATWDKVLGQATLASGSVSSISQYHYGNIEESGRVD